MPINPLLLQVLVCGAELYTSNTALMPVAYYEKKATLQQVMTPACYLSVFMRLPLAAGHNHLMIAKHFMVWLDIICIAMSLDRSKLATTCTLHDSKSCCSKHYAYPAASPSILKLLHSSRLQLCKQKLPTHLSLPACVPACMPACLRNDLVNIDVLSL